MMLAMRRPEASGTRARASATALIVLLCALVAATAYQFTSYPDESPVAPALALVLSVGVALWANRDEDGTLLLLAWALRLVSSLVFLRAIAGVAGGTPDWLTYDQQGWYLAEALRTDQALPHVAFGDASGNVSSFVAVVYAVFGRSVSSVAVIETFLGLLASWCYVRTCRALAPQSPRAVRCGLMLFPSFVFWTSIVGKDPLVNLGLALGVTGAVSLCLNRGRVLMSVALMSAGVLLCLLFRPHLVLILVPALMAGMLFSLRSASPGRPGAPAHSRAWLRHVLVVVTLVLCVILAPILARAGAGRRLWTEEGGADAWAAKAGEIRDLGARGGGSTTGYSGYTSVPGFLRALPASVATLMLRPFIWEVRNAAGAVAAVDTLLLTGICIWLLAGMVPGGRARGRGAGPTTWFLLVWLIGWVLMFVNLTGNLGTMVRQRCQIVPALLLLVGARWGPHGREHEGLNGVRHV